MSEERPEPDKRSLSPELKGTEALLAAFRPATPTIDRDRVMYEAGRAAARGSASRHVHVIHRVTTLAAVAAAVLLGFRIGSERRARDVEPDVAITVTPPTESAATVEPTSLPADAKPVKLPADSYGELRKHLAAADTDLPSPAGERRDATPDASTWRRRPNELLRGLN